MTSATMEQKPPSLSTSWPREEQDLNLREWALKGRIISRENTKSRRFSASNIKSFREETRSFRSNVAISSTASSPGYSLKEEIDPATYSFTTALKALQLRSGYGWDCLSPEGFALNSKWNEAERYICNPVSGEVPMECLSSKTLSGRTIPTKKTRLTVSGPLVYSSSHASLVQSKHILIAQDEHEVIKSPIKEEIKVVENNLSSTRDVGTQSTPTDLSSSSSPISSTSTPPIKERSLRKQCEVLLSEDSPISSSNKSKTDQEEVVQIESKPKREEDDNEKEEQENTRNNNNDNTKDKYYSSVKQKKKWMCSRGQILQQPQQHQQQGEFRCFCSGLSSWRHFFWMKKRDRDRDKLNNY